MSFLARGAKKAVRRFFPDKVAEDAGVVFLSKGGFLRERLDQVDIDESDMGALKRRHNKIVLPWLNTGGDPDHFDRNDYMNDLLEYRADLLEHIHYLRLRAFNKIQDGIKRRRLAMKIEGKKEGELPKLLNPETDIAEIPVHHGLERHLQRIDRYLGWGGDTLLGLGMDNPDDNKNLIMRTPVILDQIKTRTVWKGGGSGPGDVTKIPE